MKWQILILTQPSRKEMITQLLSLLEPQIAALGLRKFDHVDILIREWNNSLDYGANRELLRARSTGEYICFLDDDDFVAPNYVSQILTGIEQQPDQVSFDIKMWQDKKELKDARHSLSHGGWFEPTDGFCYRDISHVHPMRRDLALEVPMTGTVGEDRRWADGMRGRVKTEVHIEEPLYYYLIRTRKNDATDARDPWRMNLLAQLGAKNV